MQGGTNGFFKVVVSIGLLLVGLAGYGIWRVVKHFTSPSPAETVMTTSQRPAQTAPQSVAKWSGSTSQKPALTKEQIQKEIDAAANKKADSIIAVEKKKLKEEAEAKLRSELAKKRSADSLRLVNEKLAEAIKAKEIAKKAEEKKRADDLRNQEIAKKAEAKKLAETKKLEEARKQAETKKLADAKKAQEQSSKKIRVTLKGQKPTETLKTKPNVSDSPSTDSKNQKKESKYRVKLKTQGSKEAKPSVSSSKALPEVEDDPNDPNNPANKKTKIKN